jgi:hypothetical protein
MASKKKNDYNGTIVTINKNGEVVRTTPETTNKTVTKVNSNTSNLVSKPTVEAKQTVKMPTINTQEKANKNYEEKLSLFNKATEDLENKRINELNKRNIDLTRRLDKQDYKSQTQNGRVTDKRTLQEQQRQYDAFAPKLAELTQNEEQNRLNAQNDLRLATYQKDLADVEADDIGLLDKITNPFLSGIANVFSPITDENKYIDENGNEIYLPTRNDLKYQKVRESYGNGFLGNLARFGGDVTQEFGKQAATQAVDALTFGIGGKALYFTDIVSDQYKQNINEGYDQQTSLKDAILKGASNYVKQKLMGGLAGKLTGNTSALENTLTNTFAKAVNNPRVVSMLSSMGAEALDEFTDTYVEAGIDAAVLGKKVNADELFLDALYSSAIGGATGAGSGALNVSPEARQAVIDRQLNNQNNQVQNTQPTTQTETPQIEANEVEQTNTQPRLEQQQMSLNETNNEPTRSNEQIEQDLIREINKEQQKLDTGKSEDDGYHLAELQKELQDRRKNSIANDSNTFNLNKVDENTTLESARTPEDISNRKVNAYQYDNPEVKPYFKEAAQELNYALNEGTFKGERFMRGDGTWGGQKFSSTPEITELHNDYKMSYKDLQRGIDGIIEDTGKENNAASKKVEVVIDKMLRNGYNPLNTNINVGPNQDYLNTLSGRPVNEQANVQVDEELPFFTNDEEMPKTNNQATQNNVQQETQTNENNNIPERKSEDVIKQTRKQEAQQTTNNLNKAIKGEYKNQNFETIRNEIEEETGKPMRSWIETSTTSTGTTELVNSMNKEKITYEPTSNKKNLDSANKELAGMTYEQKLEKAKAIVNSDKRLKSTDIAILETVVQEAQKLGKVNDFIDLVQDTAILGTESGQVVQALSLIRQSDPTTQLTTLQKLIEREQAKGNKVYDGVEIKQDLVEKVLNSYNEDGTWSQGKFDNAMDELKQDIANQMHVRPSEKLNAWRYLSMLGNPKTHIRNVVANIAMTFLQGGKNKVAAGIETITPMNALNRALGGSETSTRGKTLKPSTKEVRNYSSQTIDNYFKEHKQTSKYNESMSNLKGELESRRNTFSNKHPLGFALNKLEKGNAKALDLEDVVFNKANAKSAFSNYLTANGIQTQADIDNNPEVVAQGLEYALFKGQEATFHQHSQTGTALRNFRESLRQGSNLTRIVGLGMDATMPFINTPINIAKTGIEYTPGLGMIKTISDVNSAPKNLKADVLIDSLSKQFMGGMLAAVGYGLANAGYLHGKSGEEKDEKLEKNLGKQDYSVEIGNNTYDLSWLSPSAMPLFVGVELQNALKDKQEIKPEMVMDVLTSTIDPLSEMSVVSSITEALQSYSRGTQALEDIATSAFTSYITQYIPTLMGQIATVTDDTQRSSSGKTVGEKLINQIKYKTPGLRNTLPAQIDVWGNEKKLAEDPVQRSLEAFLSPANRKELRVDKTTKEIERIYKETGSGLPSLQLTQAPKIDTKEYQLNTEEYAKYKKDYGKTAKTLLDDLMKQSEYKTATDEEKKSMISAIYDYSTYVARKNIANKENINFEYKKSNGKGYNYPKYYLGLNQSDFAEYVASKYNKEE